MNPDILPDHVLRRMDPKDRKSLGKAGVTSEEAERKRLARSERELQDQIANYLHYKGIFFVRSRMDKKTTTRKGTPDFIFALPEPGAWHGRPYAIEVKVGSNTLTREQEEVRLQMLRNGWRYFVVNQFSDFQLAIGKFNKQ